MSSFQLGALAVGLAIDLDAFNCEARLAIWRCRLVQFFPSGEKVFVCHAGDRLRPALGIEQNVRVGADVLDRASRMWRFAGICGGRCCRFRCRLPRPIEVSGD